MSNYKSEFSNFVGSLYEDKITTTDFQNKLLFSAFEKEGSTSAKDQKMQDMIYNYLQVKKAELSPEQLGSFSAILSWICVGKELSKFLSKMPKSSLNELITVAKESGFNVEVSE